MIRRPVHHRVLDVAAWAIVLVAMLLATPAPGVHAASLISTGAPLSTTGSPNSLAFSPDGRFLVNSTSQPSTLRVYAVSSSRTLKAAGVPIVGDDPHAMAFDPTGRYLAVADDTAKSISLYTVSGTGRLTRANFPAPARDGAGKLSFSRDGKLLAATLPSEQAILLFTVSPSGALTQVGGPILTGDSGRMDIAFSPVADLLAVMDADRLRTFIVAADGALTHVDDPVATGSGTTAIAFTADGQFLTTSDASSETLTTFSVAMTGALTQVGERVSDVRRPVSLAYSPEGRLLAAVNYDDNTLTTWRLSETGVVSMVDTVAALNTSFDDDVSFSPDGASIAVSLRNSSKIAIYAVSPSGHMTEVGMPVPTGKSPGNVIFDATSGRVVVGGDSLSVFSFSNGVLTSTTPPLTLSNAGLDNSVALRPDGRLIAYAVALSGTVTTYAVAADGTLSQAGSIQMPPWASATNSGTDWPFTLAFDHDGRHLAVTLAFTHRVVTYDVSDVGQLSLTATSAPTGDTTGDAMAYSPNGSLLAVTYGTVRMFAVGGDGGLTAVSQPVSTDVGAVGLAFSSDGHLLAVPIRSDSAVQLYAVSPSGELTPIGGPALAGRSPSAVAFSPDGRLLALTNRTDSTLSLYSVTPDGLVMIGMSTPTGNDPAGVTWDPAGRHVIVVNAGDATVSVFPLAATVLEPSIPNKPPRATVDDSASFYLDATYTSTFLCTLDDGLAEPCASPTHYTNLAEGHHTFEVRARDLLGTLSNTTASWTWTVDRTPPAPISLATPSAEATNLPASTTLAWSPTSDDVTSVDRYVLEVDGQAPRTIDPGACGSTCSVALDGLTDGLHHWMVTAYDAAGNSRRSATRSFGVDAAAPNAFAQRVPAADALLTSARPELSWDPAADAGTGTKTYDIVVDDRTLATLDGSATRYTPAADLGQGAHRWKVVARDAYGYERTSETRSFTVDTTPPRAVLRASPARFVAPYQVTLDASGSSDPGGQIAVYEFDLDGDGTYETSSSSPRQQTTLTTIGDHVLGVRVVDRVGLTAAATDRVAGELVNGPGSHEAFVTVNDEAAYTRTLKVSLTINPPPRSGALTMIVANDGRPDQSLRRPITRSIAWSLANGDGLRDRRTVYVTFYNSAGAQVTNGRVTDDILYDPRAPKIVSATLRLATKHRATLTIDAKDTGSGLAGFRLRVGRRSVGHGARIKRRTTLRLQGTVRDRVTLLVRDKAGNTARRTLRVLRR
ncbi:MAG: putative internalin [Frankiales bacterium]|nr:putative internalin [Frankiales bacterium]